MQPNNDQNPYQVPAQYPQQVVTPATGFVSSPTGPTPIAPIFSNNERRMRLSARKRVALLIVAAVVIIAGIVTGTVLLIKHHNASSSAISSVVASVTINTSGVTPSTISIKTGQEVTITNEDTTPHRLTADQSQLPNFDSIDMLNQGDSYTYTFESAGTFHFYDPSNPTYTGTITVN